jgi:protein-S-isoprenylcysteine O-methyltransferase Ste14
MVKKPRRFTLNIEAFVGAGCKIRLVFLPFAIGGITLNVFYPHFFQTHFGRVGTIIGTVLLVTGIPFWFVSVVQMVRYVAKNELITKGPFGIVLHPMYTSEAILILPGIGFVFNTWVGLWIGVVFYIISRFFRKQEEEKLDRFFAKEYRNYCSKVLLPWI